MYKSTADIDDRDYICTLNLVVIVIYNFVFSI